MIGNQFQLVIYGEGLSVCMLSRCLFVIIEILSYPWTRSLKHFSYYRLQSRWDNSPGLITSFIWVMSSWIWLISYQYVSLPSIVSSFYSLDTEECPTEMKKSHHSLAFYKNKFPKTKSYIVFFFKIMIPSICLFCKNIPWCMFFPMILTVSLLLYLWTSFIIFFPCNLLLFFYSSLMLCVTMLLTLMSQPGTENRSICECF